MAGIPLSTKVLSNGVMASSTYDPTVSFASSNATFSRAIFPANVSACVDAWPSNVAAKAAAAASKSFVFMMFSSSGTPSFFKAPKLPS